MLEEKEKKYLKGISKVLYIISKIGKILIAIAIPCIIVSMILLGIVVSKIDYHDNSIYFDSDRVVTFEESINGIDILFNDDFESNFISIKSDNIDITDALSIKNFFDRNSISKILVYIELSLAFTISILILTRMILDHVEKFFRNVYEQSPFTEENKEHLRMIAKLMLISFVVSIIMEVILKLIISNNLNIKLGLSSIFDLLIIFSAYYIFKYGAILQSKSNIDIYEDKK